MTAGPNRITRGWFYRRHHAEGVLVRDEEIIAPDWPKAFDGIRIGHVSDLHVGDMMKPDRAIEIISQLHDERPDLVCNTGDLVDLHWPGVEPVADALAAIDAPLGNYFVTGNHDELDSGDDVERIVAEAGTTVLHDDVALVRRGDDTLRIGGIGWARTPSSCRSRIDRALGDETVDLLLSHNPKAFDHAAEKGVPLTLSGHTHGGQIARRNRPNGSPARASPECWRLRSRKEQTLRHSRRRVMVSGAVERPRRNRHPHDSKWRRQVLMSHLAGGHISCSTAARARVASALCERRFFSSGRSSALVTPSGSTRSGS